MECASYAAEVTLRDESCFIVNNHKKHARSDENSHSARSSRQQRQFSISPRAGILGDCFILPARFGRSDYFQFPWIYLSGLLEDVSYKARLHMWSQHDGASSHCSREVYTNGYKKFFLNAGFVADVWSFRFVAYTLTRPQSSRFMRILQNKDYVAIIDTREKLWRQVQQLAGGVKITLGIFRKIFFFTRRWTVCLSIWRPTSSTSCKKVKIERLFM